MTTPTQPLTPVQVRRAARFRLMREAGGVSAYQEAILRWVVQGTGNGVVNATAGSGKTTTARKVAALLDGEENLFLAFNRHIAETLRKHGLNATTCHSLGLSALRRMHKNVRMSDGKTDLIIDALLTERNLPHLTQPYAEVKAAIRALLRYVQATLTDPTDISALHALTRRYNIDLPDDTHLAALTVSLIPHVLDRSLQHAQDTGEITFDEMIYLPWRLKLRPRTYAWLIVDEAQDLNRAQLELLLSALRRGGRMLFVGDRFQSIYGFSGADHDAIPNIIERVQAHEMPLSVTYRCPISHVKLAQRLVPEMEWAPNAKQGVVRHIKASEVAADVTEGSLLLCRTTAPLISTCFQLIARGINAKVKGKDIVAGLLKDLERMEKQPGFTFPAWRGALEVWRADREATIRAKAKTDEALALRLADLDDRAQVLAIIIQASKATDMAGVKASAKALFSDDKPGVTLSSVHRAKGLEAERVYILKPEKMPHPAAQTHEDRLQEQNILFVALTRSLHEMVFVETEDEDVEYDFDFGFPTDAA